MSRSLWKNCFKSLSSPIPGCSAILFALLYHASKLPQLTCNWCATDMPLYPISKLITHPRCEDNIPSPTSSWSFGVPPPRMKRCARRLNRSPGQVTSPAGRNMGGTIRCSSLLLDFLDRSNLKERPPCSSSASHLPWFEWEKEDWSNKKNLTKNVVLFDGRIWASRALSRWVNPNAFFLWNLKQLNLVIMNGVQHILWSDCLDNVAKSVHRGVSLFFFCCAAFLVLFLLCWLENGLDC